MASITKDSELCSFDVPEVTRSSYGYVNYKIVLQVTPKELTENSYQVCIFYIIELFSSSVKSISYGHKVSYDYY